MEHEMHDMDEIKKISTMEDEATKEEKQYPVLSISSKQMPELKGKKFGDSVAMHIRGEVEGMHEDYDNKEEAIYEIKIMECGMMGKISKDEYMNMSDEEKDKADKEEVMGEEE